MWKYWNPGALLVGMQNGAKCTTVVQSGISSEKLNTEWLRFPASPSLVHRPPKMKADSNRYLYASVHSNIIQAAQRWQRPKCPSAGECTTKTRYRHTLEYSSAMKQCRSDTCYNTREPQKRDTKREKSDQRTNMASFYLHKLSRIGNIGTDSRKETLEGWRGRAGGYFWMDRKFLLGNNGNVQNVLEIVTIAAKQCKCS